MSTVSLHQFLLLYSWFALAALLGFMLLIARFYARFSQERTFYTLYLLPIVFYGMATVRYASINRFWGDVLADGLAGIAGVILIALCYRLYRLMLLAKGQH